jgi:small-conductance mechanosensitive channel
MIGVFLNLRDWLFGAAQMADDTPPADVVTDESALAEPVVEGTVTVEPGDSIDLSTPQDVTQIVVEAAPVVRPPQNNNAIEALSETTEKATEAASEFVTWVGSGQLEALIAVGLVIGITTALWLLRWGILKGIVRLPRMDDYSFSAFVQRIVKRFHIYFMVAIALLITDMILSLPGAVSGFVRFFFIICAVLQVAEWVQEFAVSAMKRNVHRSSGDARALQSAFNIIKYFITLGVWAVALLLIMSNVGMDVTALLAGLGIGGIAIGIAAQGVFRDLFSSISIVIDKPFQVGDTIRYGDNSWGAVEDIGLKTTRIRAKSGEQLIISNTNLLEQEIHNMARMTRRRIELQFGFIYQTSPDLAERVPEIVAKIVKEIQAVEFERCGMSGFGPSSIDFTLVFFALQPEFNRSMAARSKVFLALFRCLQDEGLEFAYPTQTLFIEGMDKG